MACFRQPRHPRLESLAYLAEFVDALDGKRFNECLMSLLKIPDLIYIGVTDAVAASPWYKEKLGLQQVVAPTSDAGDCVSLAFSNRDEAAIVLGSRDSTTDQRPIYTLQISERRTICYLLAG